MSSRKMYVVLILSLTVLWGLSAGLALAQGPDDGRGPGGPPPGPPPAQHREGPPGANPAPHPEPNPVAPSTDVFIGSPPGVPPGAPPNMWFGTAGEYGRPFEMKMGPGPWNWNMTPDPETQALREKEGKLEGDVQKIIKDYNSSKDKDERAKLKKQLEEVSGQQFEVRQQYRELEVKRLETELARIRESIQKRNEIREQIIKRRIAQLLHEYEDLEF